MKVNSASCIFFYAERKLEYVVKRISLGVSEKKKKIVL